jgi:hypothetical protein
MAAVPRRIADHPINRIVELLAWNLFPAAGEKAERPRLHDSQIQLNRDRVHNRGFVDTIQNEIRTLPMESWQTLESEMGAVTFSV